jgi:DNA-binding NarL/FixJ family response regulator
MSDTALPRSPERSLQLFLIDDDPIFSLGLATALAVFDDFYIRDRAETANAFATLAAFNDRENLIAIADLPTPARGIDPLQFFQQLQENYPDLPILLLSAAVEPRLLKSLQVLGVAGYRPKGTSSEELAAILRQIAAGNTVWPTQTAKTLQPLNLQLSVPESPPQWLLNLRRSGLSQIEASLAKIQQQLEQQNLPTFDWFYWQGRQRELKVARSLVDRLLPVEVAIVSPSKEEPAQTPPVIPPTSSELVVLPSPIEELLGKVRLGVRNKTNLTLEIDILQLDKRQELLYITIRQLQEVLEELRFLKVTREELSSRIDLFLREIWQKTTLEFLNKYYPETKDSLSLVDLVRQNSTAIAQSQLQRIPFVFELLDYFLYDGAIAIDNVVYRHESPEAKARIADLLDNLAIGIARETMQFLLNQFAEEETIKYNLYDRNFISSREIARLRNELSWQFRQNRYFLEPKAIFESRYRLLILVGSQIQIKSISAPRLTDLEALRGVPFLVTLALETRDALAPRVRAVVAFLGRGVVYVLTQVIGKAIGLIGQGIIQGLGNVVQETRYRKK